jgi:nucleotide-binding universal stress UspA family protein
MAVVCVPTPAAAHGEPGPQTNIRHVLVPTDLSVLANQALAHACAVVERGGVIHLLHVVAPADGAPEATLEARLRRLVPKEAEARGLRVEVEIVEGEDVAHAICQTAERLGVDAICLSTHGWSGLSRALCGSVAQAVITACPRRLIIVRPGREA